MVDFKPDDQKRALLKAAILRRLGEGKLGFGVGAGGGAYFEPKK